MADRPYVFYELTNAICPTCLRKVEAKVVIQDGRVYLKKRCPAHGPQSVLISTDADYYKLCREYLKPGQLPLKFNTPIKHGCPYDCGLCPDHEQHSCLTLVEITDACNLECPICYSDSSPRRLTHRSFEQVEFMLDAVVRNEGEPDVVQISGGEPTEHPEFFRILDAAKARPIKHLMLNTNGVRIAADAEFARRLAGYAPGFEIYLQFDSLREGPLRELRGANLVETRRRAIERLNELDLSTTLVVTLKKGLNDDEIGEILDFAVRQPSVRGVTFQPIQAAGRTEGFDPERDRLTLAEVRSAILEQSPLFTPADLIPVPCHPDCLAMAYALKIDGKTVPLTSLVDPKILLQGAESTILFEQNPALRERVFGLFSTAHSPDSSARSLARLLCCLPEIPMPADVGYRDVFRVIIMKFMDPYDLDVRSVKKTCVHIAHPDGRIIPFDTFNIFYRDKRTGRLADLVLQPEPSIVSIGTG